MSKLPEDGELVCVMPTEKFLHPHTLALYLGAGKIVLASHINGWMIGDIQELDNFSAFGRSNIRKTYQDADGTVTGYDYLAYDSGQPTELNLRLVEGSWIISNEFELPSWAKPKTALLDDSEGTLEALELPGLLDRSDQS
jgi:hypothetical protein